MFLDTVCGMADPRDRALGDAIRRRRQAVGLQQREIAEKLGLTAIVYGRMELGNRPIKALELREIAQALGTDMDALMQHTRHVSPEEMVERAEVQRDAAYSALKSYASSAVDAITAVVESKDGAAMDDADFVNVRTAEDVIDYLCSSQDRFVGLRAPAEVVPLLRRALVAAAESIAITPTEGADD